MRSFVPHQPPETAPGSSCEIRLAKALRATAARGQPLLSGLLTVAAGFLPKASSPPWGSPATCQEAVFLYCVKGGGWCEVGGRFHAIQTGDLLVLPPHTPHACRAHASEPWTLHWVQALGARLPDYLRALQADPRAPVLHVGEDPQLIRLFNEILRALQRGADFVHLLQASHACAYLLALVIQKRLESPPENSDTIQKVAEAIILMSEHLDQPLRVSALARLASLSPAYFSQLFKDQTGCSPREYLHLLRMHRACQLLQNTSASVKQIATRLGYQDQFHFSRQFKAFQGLSPSQYRQVPPGPKPV